MDLKILLVGTDVYNNIWHSISLVDHVCDALPPIPCPNNMKPAMIKANDKCNDGNMFGLGDLNGLNECTVFIW